MDKNLKIGDLIKHIPDYYGLGIVVDQVKTEHSVVCEVRWFSCDPTSPEGFCDWELEKIS